MARVAMTPAVVEIVAARFKALAEPARLQILDALREGESTVTELVDRTGFGQPNLSKHLRLLHSLGFVSRRKEGLFVYYGLADRSVFQLCDIMCSRVASESTMRRKLFATR
jgi:ArsR family transcriptional regulator